MQGKCKKIKIRAEISEVENAKINRKKINKQKALYKDQ